MGARLFTKLEDPQEILRAAGDVAEWGYPRLVEQSEIADADWFRYGDDVIFWFQHFPQPPVSFVHLSISPDGRSRAGLYMGQARWLRFVYGYAKDQGAKHLGFIRCIGAESTESYLRQIGWSESGAGLIKEL